MPHGQPIIKKVHAPPVVTMPPPTLPPAPTLAPESVVPAVPELTPPVSPPPVEIIIEDGKYVPNDVTIQVGRTVKWTNLESKKHTVTGGQVLRSKDLGRRGTYQHTFTKPGVIKYHCKYHKEMTGTITVAE